MGERYSRSTGQRVTGFRGALIGIDDPLDATQAHSDSAALTDHVRWYDEALSTREQLGVDTRWVLVMQRLHARDLAGVLIGRNAELPAGSPDRWDVLSLPAEYDPAHAQPPTSIGWTDPRMELGERISPLLTERRLRHHRVTLGPRGYAAQYMQAPAVELGGMYTADMVQYWRRVSLPTVWDSVVLSVDSAYKTTHDSDYVGMQVWAAVGAERYLLWGHRARMTTARLIKAIREIVARYEPGATVIESQANGPEVIASIRREVPGVIGVRHQGESKISRAEAVLPQWAAGQVWVPAIEEPEGQYVRDYFIPELIAFPDSGHDDQVDAMSQALIWLAHRR